MDYRRGIVDTGKRRVHPRSLPRRWINEMRKTVNTKYVVYIVGTVLVLCVTGIIALSAGLGASPDGVRPIPDILQNIASGALAGLLGLLVAPPTGKP